VPAGRMSSASTDELCGEHGVLEAVCTKCNPKLAPVFQAKGDWCEEHGFPESVCPICHPERGGKPGAAVSREEAPADGTKVRFKSRDTARLAGITTAAAEARPGGARLTVLATIEYDATRRAEVNARSPGVVRALRADLGARVAAGAPLAVLESAAVGSERSRLVAARTRLAVAEENLARERERADCTREAARYPRLVRVRHAPPRLNLQALGLGRGVRRENGGLPSRAGLGIVHAPIIRGAGSCAGRPYCSHSHALNRACCSVVASGFTSSCQARGGSAPSVTSMRRTCSRRATSNDTL